MLLSVNTCSTTRVLFQCQESHRCIPATDKCWGGSSASKKGRLSCSRPGPFSPSDCTTGRVDQHTNKDVVPRRTRVGEAAAHQRKAGFLVLKQGLSPHRCARVRRRSASPLSMSMAAGRHRHRHMMACNCTPYVEYLLQLLAGDACSCTPYEESLHCSCTPYDPHTAAVLLAWPAAALPMKNPYTAAALPMIPTLQLSS